MLLALTSCGSVSHLHETYAGYKVIDKKRTNSKRSVPIRVKYCVMPNGALRCKTRYGGWPPSKCSLNCRVQTNLYNNPDRWVVREEGTREETVKHYILILKATDGTQKRIFASPEQYSSSSVGQILGKLPPQDAQASASQKDNMPHETAMPTGKTLVLEVQSELQNHGFNPGPIDGLMGDKTRRAIRLFQAKHGMKQTGEINRTLYDRLKSAEYVSSLQIAAQKSSSLATMLLDGFVSQLAMAAKDNNVPIPGRNEFDKSRKQKYVRTRGLEPVGPINKPGCKQLSVAGYATQNSNDGDHLRYILITNAGNVARTVKLSVVGGATLIGKFNNKTLNTEVPKRGKSQIELDRSYEPPKMVSVLNCS